MKPYLLLVVGILSLNLSGAEDVPKIPQPAGSSAATPRVKLPDNFQTIQKQLIDAPSEGDRYAVLSRLSKSVPQLSTIQIKDAESLANALANHNLTDVESAKLIQLFSDDTSAMRPERPQNPINGAFAAAGPGYYPDKHIQRPSNEDMQNVVLAIKTLQQTIIDLNKRLDAIETKGPSK